MRLRLLGGLAVRLRCPSAGHRLLKREYGDIDFCAPREDLRKLTPFFVERGFQPWLPFNQLNAEFSQRFDGPDGRVSVDVFMDRLVMCHTLELRDRLGLSEETLTLADLLLSKLQVVQLTEKDLQDIFALLLDHPFGEDGIDVERIVEVCANDWGWYRTTSETVRRCQAALPRFGEGDEAMTLRLRFERLQKEIEEAPKSRRWKLRAKIGDRRQWYEVPEDPTRKAEPA